MLKSLIKKTISNKYLIGPITRQALKFHNFLYKIISRLSILENNGIHPKHQIIRYDDWFKSHIPLDSTVLDIGCNTGLLAYSISKKAKKVTGIDIEKSHIDQAKKNYNEINNLDFVCADATKYQFEKNEKFSHIVLSNVLEHIDQRVLFLQKIRTAFETYSPTVLIRVPQITKDWVTIYKKNLGIYWKTDPTHFTEYTEEELVNELNQVGLKVQTLSINFGEIYLVAQFEGSADA